MKIRSILLLLCCVLFSSCFIKSLHPFYTKKTISFDARFVGTWEDKHHDKWVVQDLKVKVLEENGITSIDQLPDSDRELYEQYKGGYYVTYTDDDKGAAFIVMPFKISGQSFLDFTPVYLDDVNDINGLSQNHLVGSHSIVKFDVLKNGTVSMRWLDQDKIGDLFEQNKIKIKHTIITGFILQPEILLTADSEDLQKFIKKYMTSDDESKWKTDTKFTLKRVDA